MKFKTIETFAKKGDVVSFVRPEHALHFEINPIVNFDPYYELLKKTEEVVGTVPGQGDIKKSTVDSIKAWQDWMIVVALTGYSVVKQVEVRKKVKVGEGETVEEKEEVFLEPQIVEAGALPWEKVLLDDIKTYDQWEAELTEFGLTRLEVSRLRTAIFEVNNMSDATLEKARADFLHLKQQISSLSTT